MYVCIYVYIYIYIYIDIYILGDNSGKGGRVIQVSGKDKGGPSRGGFLINILFS